MYFQDDWKVSSNLTVNLGVRYNVEPPKIYKGGYISLFDLTVPDNSIYYQHGLPALLPGGRLHGRVHASEGRNPVRHGLGPD